MNTASNSKPSGGIMNTLKGVFGLNNSSKNSSTRNTLKNSRMNTMNSSGMNKDKTTQLVTPQAGGMAPVNFQYPANMRQPSDEIMEWATTAGLPRPMTGMRNIAHGGGKHRKSRKHRKSMKRRASRARKTHHKRKHPKRKTYKRRH